jgi:hypothetical protein
MNRATKIAATSFGIYAGFLGAVHGYFEIQQGNAAPEGILINAIGAPCRMDTVWHACLPAITIIPSFLVTGILVMIVGFILAIWAVAFVHKKHGGLVMILLSIVLALVGGGFIPAFIGITAGAAGTKINAPLTGQQSSKSWSRFPAKLWPWPLIAYFVWIPIEWLLGHFFNEFLLKQSTFAFISKMGLLLLTVFTAFAVDIQRNTDHQQNSSINK